MKEGIEQAIRSRKIVQFLYDGKLRVVESHMLADNDAGHLSLSGRFLRGFTNPGEAPGWREYIVSGISSFTLLMETFPRPRPGYNPTGGKKFRNVRCAL